MARLLAHVEGDTEEEFVNEVLRGHLLARGYDSVRATKLGSSRRRDHRGGNRAWSSARKDIIRHLREDQGCIATTMVDYYGLPRTGDKAWPGRAYAGAGTAAKASAVETALLADVSAEMGVKFDPRRFIPFVVMHEFEGLLFSDCAAFARGIDRPVLQGKFQAIRDRFPTPEDINDSAITAPSKRIVKLMPEYNKRLFGSLAALEIGLEKIRLACPHFGDWLARLEAPAI